MSKNKTTPIQQAASSAPVEEKVLDQTTPAVEDKQEEQPKVEEQPSTPQVEETPAVVVPEVQEVAQQPSSPFEEGALVATPKKSLLFDMVINGVQKYAKEMGARVPQSSVTGAVQQKNLYDTYQVLFKLTPPEMRDALDEIIAIFKANETGCFTESHLFRFSENIALSKVAAKGFYNFSHLLLTASQLGKRDAGRLNDLGGMVSWLPNEEVHQLLVNYFR